MKTSSRNERFTLMREKRKQLRFRIAAAADILADLSVFFIMTKLISSESLCLLQLINATCFMSKTKIYIYKTGHGFSPPMKYISPKVLQTSLTFS